MATIKELTDIVKGQADVVRTQLSSQHEAQQANRQHIDVSEMANIDTLKLPQVVLPRLYRKARIATWPFSGSAHYFIKIFWRST